MDPWTSSRAKGDNAPGHDFPLPFDPAGSNILLTLYLPGKVIRRSSDTGNLVLANMSFDGAYVCYRQPRPEDTAMLSRDVPVEATIRRIVPGGEYRYYEQLMVLAQRELVRGATVTIASAGPQRPIDHRSFRRRHMDAWTIASPQPHGLRQCTLAVRCRHDRRALSCRSVALGDDAGRPRRRGIGAGDLGTDPCAPHHTVSAQCRPAQLRDSTIWISSANATDNNRAGICWSRDLSRYVAVASSGTGNRVMTSVSSFEYLYRS